VSHVPLVMMRVVDDVVVDGVVVDVVVDGVVDGDGMLLPWSMNNQEVRNRGLRHTGSKHRNHGGQHCPGQDLAQPRLDNDGDKQRSDNEDDEKLYGSLHHIVDSRALVRLHHILPIVEWQEMKEPTPVKWVLEREREMLY